MVLLPPVYYPLRELVTLIKGRTTFASTRACAYQRPWGYYPLIILLLRQQQYGATVARLHRIFLLFGLLVAEHYIKIDRASNRVQLWRICAVFFSALLAYALQAYVAHEKRLSICSRKVISNFC